MLNKTVLMSGVDYFDDSQPINPFMTRQEPIDREKARAEHDQIRQALESAGVTVIKVDPPAGCQDGVYTANWALVRGSTAVMARLPNARKGEEVYAEHVLMAQGKTIVHVPDEFKFSGQGDALPCGNYLFCGSTYRSDVAAQAFVAETLGYERIQLEAVPQTDTNGLPVTNAYSGWPDSFYYDIDLAISILKAPQEVCTHGAQASNDGAISSRGADGAVSEYGDESTAEKNSASTEEVSSAGGSAAGQGDCSECRGLIAWCPQAFTEESQQVLRSFDTVDKIEVASDEAKFAFACNLVSTGQTVAMSAEAPLFKAEIEAHGLQVITPEITELAKGGGYIRCTTLTLDN
jgi:N-dimethylarginine dimethylaminohydrolase